MAASDADRTPAAALVTTPLWAEVPPADGHYESVYLTAWRPDGGQAVWIRYTVHKRPGRAPTGAVWFTLFDAGAGVRASKAPTAAPSGGGDALLALGDNVIGPGGASGRARSDRLDAAWELRFSGAQAPLWHFPRRWMYRAALPRTKVLSPYPSVSVDGTVRAGARTIRLEGWTGTVGHNWGSEHAHRAIWLHGANFAGHAEAWFDVAIGRVALGPVITPWVANGALALDGHRHRLGGLGRRVSVREEHERCRFVLRGEGVTVTGEAQAPREHFVGWIYAQPDGRERHTINCSIADLRLSIAQAGRPELVLESRRGAAYELQMAQRYPPIAVQPFPDG